MSIHYAQVPSPVGPLLVVVKAGALYRLVLAREPRARRQPAADWVADERAVQHVVTQLDEYFRGERRQFQLALYPQGTTFQRSVWEALRAIPYGETRSYAQVARAIGRPRAVRAMGAANGANPLPIVVPCHRVIGSNGALTGFGGGLPVKRYLLELERTGTR